MAETKKTVQEMTREERYELYIQLLKSRPADIYEHMPKLIYVPGSDGNASMIDPVEPAPKAKPHRMDAASQHEASPENNDQESG